MSLPNFVASSTPVAKSPMKLLPALSPKVLPLVLALALLQGVPAADGRSTIRGAVRTLGPDDMPVYLPGAQIILRCEKSADKPRTTVTDENGRFSLPDLPTDKCSVTARAQGFRSETRIVAATDNSAVELSFQLQLLTVTERRERP
jgi:hypothetical protein